MRVLLLSAILLSLLAVVLGGGARFPTFSQQSPLPSITLPAKFETLPEETLPTKFLPDVVNTKYTDQEILQPKTIKQEIIQQRLVYQPIIRTRIVHQPILRHVYNKNVIRPHVRATEQYVPVYKTQDVVVPKIEERTQVQESFKKETQQMQPKTLPATYEGKSRAQLYNAPADDPPAEAMPTQAVEVAPAQYEQPQQMFAQPAQEEMQM